MRPGALLLAGGLLVACGAPTEASALARAGVVSGPVVSEVAGDAWAFLYGPGEGPPGPPAVPRYVTAVSAARLREEPRFVFGAVAPDAYRLWGLLDVDRDFDPQVDVLAQPTAGDRVARGVELQAQPARGAEAELRLDGLVATEPPAFSLEGAGPDVSLEPQLDAVTPLTLVADDLGRFDAQRGGFTLGLVDGDGDGRPDDLDGDGAPELSLQLFLRWLPAPGQLEPGATVVVPLAFDPSPFLRTLEGRLGATVTADRLQAVMVPWAQQLGAERDGGGGRPFGPPPAGQYELVALAAGGQFWRLPNQLGPGVPSQAVRLRIDRNSR